MKTVGKIFVSFILLALATLVLVGCNQNGQNPGVDEKVTITFNSNGGSDVSAVEVVKGSRFMPPAAPTKEGASFLFWSYKGINLQLGHQLKNRLL